MEQWASVGFRRFRTPISTMAHPGYRNGHHERYRAVNLENNATVEIRIFKGTLKKETFLKNIEFCKSAFDFTKQAGRRSITLDKYLEYVQAHKNELPNLHQWFIAKGIYTAETVNQEQV